MSNEKIISKTITSIDGTIVPPNKAVISVLDNALLYGEGLFETCLAVGSRVVFFGEHFRRLKRGCEQTDMKLPVSYRELRQWVSRIVEKHPARIKQVRLTLTAGEAARWAGKQGKPRVILSAAPHTIPTEPFSLHLSNYPVDSASIFRRIKTTSYALNVTAYKEAKKHGCDDALLLNNKGRVSEVTSANIFWVSGGAIHTPSLDDGCLEGITRARLLKEADKLNLEIVETSDTLTGLLKAHEVFISSSLKLVAPVRRIVHEKNEHTFQTGPVSRSLRKAFFKIAGLPSE